MVTTRKPLLLQCHHGPFIMQCCITKSVLFLPSMAHSWCIDITRSVLLLQCYPWHVHHASISQNLCYDCNATHGTFIMHWYHKICAMIAMPPMAHPSCIDITKSVLLLQCHPWHIHHALISQNLCYYCNATHGISIMHWCSGAIFMSTGWPLFRYRFSTTLQSGAIFSV